MDTRYYQIGRITIQVNSDLPYRENTFGDKFKAFRVPNPGDDLITIHHHFTLPNFNDIDLGEMLYEKPPWRIYRSNDSYNYILIGGGLINSFSKYCHDYSLGHIYHSTDKVFNSGNFHSLTFYPTDQILLVPLLSDRRGFILHAAGMAMDNGQGILFVGHSEAGKSTIVTMLREMGEILCDDRIIVRLEQGSFKIYGTWSHGDVSDVSARLAPLRAIMILEKSSENRIIPITDQNEIIHILPSYLIKALITPHWWIKTLGIFSQLVREIPFYRLQFDKSGKVKSVVRQFLDD